MDKPHLTPSAPLPDDSRVSPTPERSRLPSLQDPRDQEIAALRERLAFYESFDAIIRDNIARAGELLREAATKQVDSEIQLRITIEQHAEEQLEERSSYRRLFSSLLDDVTTVQQQVERIARQVADALDEVEAQLPAAGELAAIERGDLASITGRAAAERPAELGSGHSHEQVHLAAEPPQPAVHDVVMDNALDELPFDDFDDSLLIEPDDLPLDADAIDAAEDFMDDEAVTEFSDATLDADLESDLFSPEQGPAGGGHDVLLAEHVPGATSAQGDSPSSSVAVIEVADAGPSDAVDDASAEAVPAGIDATAEEAVSADDASLATTVEAPAEDSSDETDDAADTTGAAADGASSAGAVPTEASAADAPPLGEPPTRHEAADEPSHGAAASAGQGADAPGETAETASGAAPPSITASLQTAVTRIVSAITGDAEPAVSDREPSDAAEAGATEAPSKLRRLESERGRDPGWSAGPPPSQEPAQADIAVSAARDTTVLVHGVPRATTALSLKRYLEGLADVRTVEPREYAEGVLRLSVTGERPLRIEDLAGWPDGPNLEPVLARDDLLEVRLPR